MHVLPVKHRQMALLQMESKRASCVSVFLSSLSCVVCVQAAFILQNLLVMPMPANAEEAKNSHWQVSRSASLFFKSLYRRLTFFVCFSLSAFSPPLSIPSLSLASYWERKVLLSWEQECCWLVAALWCRETDLTFTLIKLLCQNTKWILN